MTRRREGGGGPPPPPPGRGERSRLSPRPAPRSGPEHASFTPRKVHGLPDQAPVGSMHPPPPAGGRARGRRLSPILSQLGGAGARRPAAAAGLALARPATARTPQALLHPHRPTGTDGRLASCHAQWVAQRGGPPAAPRGGAPPCPAPPPPRFALPFPHNSLEPVAQHQHQGQALPLLVGAGRRFGRLWERRGGKGGRVSVVRWGAGAGELDRRAPPARSPPAAARPPILSPPRPSSKTHKDAAQLVQHEVLGRIDALHVLALAAATHDGWWCFV